MERNYIGVNLINVLTIGLMALVGMAVLGFGASVIRTKIANG